MTETQLPKGITLGELGARKEELDLMTLLGDTKVLVFRHSDEGSPLYATPEEGIPSGYTAGQTSVFNLKEGESPSAGNIAGAVVVPLTPTNKNLHEDQVLLGRALTNDMRLVSSQISKVHVRFELDEGKWQVVDLGSSNG
ncbi:MAG: FHA domain-containing protein, partial [Planctomycetes bacterium]|nr:FHA domain-containing protein [Planctomycetota bacterium]